MTPIEYLQKKPHKIPAGLGRIITDEPMTTTTRSIRSIRYGTGKALVMSCLRAAKEPIGTREISLRTDVTITRAFRITRELAKNGILIAHAKTGKSPKKFEIKRDKQS